MKNDTKITLTLKQIKKLVKESAVKEDSFDVVDDPTADPDKLEKKSAAKKRSSRRRDVGDWEREFFPELFSEGRKSKVTFEQLKNLVKESIPDRDRWNNLMDVKNEARNFFVDKYNNGDIYGEFHAGTYSSLLANIEYDGWKAAGSISGDDDLVIYVNEDGVYCCTQFEEDEDDEDGCFWYCEFVQLGAEMVDKLRDAGIID